MGDDSSLVLTGWGTAQADVASIGALRKAIPAWAPADTPGHFLKHADEQTVVAVAAIDAAIRSGQLEREHLAEWSVVAAPRCIGRITGAGTLERFTRGGGPAISPHLIPQSSLHSVSGALSILLGSRRPNLGVGGGDDALSEALLITLTLPTWEARGVWLVATGWEPEPILDDAQRIINAPRCFAVALALKQGAASSAGGHLTLTSSNPARIARHADQAPDLHQLCAGLDSLPVGGACFSWNLLSGLAIELEARPRVSRLAAAA